MHPVVLLHGPEGVGKRPLALWMAAKFLCRTKTACGTCGSCREVLAGIHPDLLLIDEPEETSLKTAVLEDLQRNLDMLSSEGVRVAIITDCDRMTREAANRMLKTLEEPPEHVRIIMTTSRPRALLPTVLGRCLQWRVTPPHELALLPWLKAELTKRGRTNESDELCLSWLRRLGCCPGLVLRELDDADDRGAAISSRIHSLLAAGSPGEVLRIADELVRTTKATLADILSASEWELNLSYRRCDQTQNASVSSDAAVRIRRRRTLQSLRALAMRGKVHLNAQLAAESIGLAAFTAELGRE
jgi:DNA polymerase-3 subunit delta'